MQLSKLLDLSPRVTASIQLDVLVCSASSAEIGVVVVKDETGSELLQLGSHHLTVTAGDVIHLEAQRCLLRKREVGIEITQVPLIDIDGNHPVRRLAGELQLAAGLHPFQLDYFNLFGRSELELTCQLPDGSIKPVALFLTRANNQAGNASNMVAGVEALGYEGAWLNLPDFSLLEPVKSLTMTNLPPVFEPQTEMVGIRFKGFFSAPADGKYIFNLASDDGSMLFIDTPNVPVTTIRHQDAPAPLVTNLRATIATPEIPKWLSVEGRVVFASKSGKGLRFELQSQPDSIWVSVADANGMDPVSLLNTLIQVKGIGRAVRTPSEAWVLGELLVATAEDVIIREDSVSAISVSNIPPPLVTVGKVQGLSKDEANRHLPVRIRGVVTSVPPPVLRYMSLQDETRGIFVRLSPNIKATVVVGDLCEVVGYAAPGDFAPIVVAQDLVVLGKGQMPPPARPTWNELINGSMDNQRIEFQGLVTAVKNNSLTFLLPEGEVRVEIQPFILSQLSNLERAVVRIRGVLFSSWNTNRTVQVGHLAMRNVDIDVDVPAPRDPFDVPMKSWSELYQFDPRAALYQRAKVRGTVIYADAMRAFLVNNGRGIRVATMQTNNAQFGDEVEVIGYPDITGPSPLLRQAVLRKTGRTIQPVPVDLDKVALSREMRESTLVRISGVLMGIHSEPDSRVLEMNADGHFFLARIQGTTNALSLPVGSRLSLTGVYIDKAYTSSGDSRSGGFELLLNSSSQLAVISMPSWWTPEKLLVMVGLLLTILVLSSVWISQLQRLVEQRTRQLRHETHEREVAERERALETERSRIARDLHDDLGSSLTEISVLASKGQRSGALNDLGSLFRTISAKARGLVTALDVIVWAVDPKDNSLESLADYLGDFASEYLSHTGITCRFDIPVALPPIVLSGQLRHGLLLAVKETLNNVERHAQATEVEFRMVFDQGRLEIVISDNGKGFDTTARNSGNGLKNLPLRLSKLGGRYAIESALGEGTLVTIEVRIPSSNETIVTNAQS